MFLEVPVTYCVEGQTYISFILVDLNQLGKDLQARYTFALAIYM